MQLSWSTVVTGFVISMALVMGMIVAIMNPSYSTRFGPPFGTGSIDIEYTSEINQTLGQSVTREYSPSVSRVVLLNETPLHQYLGVQVPVYDYDEVHVSATVEAVSDVVAAELVVLIHFANSTSRHIEQTIERGQWTNLVLTVDMDSVRNASSSWTNYWHIEVNPYEDLIWHNVAVWASSSKPLSRVIVDVQSTAGASLFQYEMMRFLAESPYLDVGRENETRSGFSLHKANCSLYLAPGEIAGLIGWGSDSNIYDVLPLNLTIHENETVRWNIRILAIRLDFAVNVRCSVGYLWVYGSSDPGTHVDLYDAHVDFDRLDSLYMPPRRSLYVEVRWLDLLGDYSKSNYRERAEGQAGNWSAPLGTENIQISIEFPGWDAYGFALNTGDMLLLSSGLMLMAAVIVRSALLVPRKPGDGLRLGSRLVPIILMLGLSLFPWYESSRTISDWWNAANPIQVNMVLFGPIPVILASTSGSLMSFILPQSALYWAALAFFVYWLPLIYATVRAPAASDWAGNLRRVFLLAMPALYALVFPVVMPLPVHLELVPTPVVLLTYIVPIAWLAAATIALLLERHNTRVRALSTGGSGKSGGLTEQVSSKAAQASASESDSSRLGAVLFTRGLGNRKVKLLLVLLLLSPTLVGFHYASPQYDWQSQRFEVLEGIVWEFPALIYPLPFAYSQVAGFDVMWWLFSVPYVLCCYIAIVFLWYWTRRGTGKGYVKASLFLAFTVSVAALVVRFPIPSYLSTVWVPTPISVIAIAIALGVQGSSADHSPRSVLAVKGQGEPLTVAPASSGTTDK